MVKGIAKQKNAIQLSMQNLQDDREQRNHCKAPFDRSPKSPIKLGSKLSL